MKLTQLLLCIISDAIFGTLAIKVRSCAFPTTHRLSTCGNSRTVERFSFWFCFFILGRLLTFVDIFQFLFKSVTAAYTLH